MHKLSYKLTIAAVAALLMASSAAFAISSHANAHADNAGAPSPPQASASAAPGNSHAAAGQLKACQNRQQAIQNIMARIVDRGTKQIGVFDSIASRTETFYTSHGKTVANYSALVAAVNAAKSKAQTDLATVKATSTFSCDSSSPKGMVQSFQSDLRLEIADLQAYKTAVKNLIVAVKSAEGAGSSSSPSPSASPSTSPSTSPSPQGGNE